MGERGRLAGRWLPRPPGTFGILQLDPVGEPVAVGVVCGQRRSPASIGLEEVVAEVTELGQVVLVSVA